MKPRAALLFACLVGWLTGIGSAVAPAQVAAPALPADIRCEAGGSYMGNAIDLRYSLTITGPKERSWKYVCRDVGPFGRHYAGPSGYAGTYEIHGDLAVFTGKPLRPAKGADQEVRFGLNFGFHGKQVYFDRFFPGEDGAFHYHRKWFHRKKAGKWRPVEERILTLRSKGPAGETWKVAIEGERVLWDEQGKRQPERCSVTAVWKKAYRMYSLERRPRKWLPGVLWPQKDGGRLLSIAVNVPYIADIRGFHPRLARVRQ